MLRNLGMYPCGGHLGRALVSLHINEMQIFRRNSHMVWHAVSQDKQGWHPGTRARITVLIIEQVEATADAMPKIGQVEWSHCLNFLECPGLVFWRHGHERLQYLFRCSC